MKLLSLYLLYTTIFVTTLCFQADNDNNNNNNNIKPIADNSRDAFDDYPEFPFTTVIDVLSGNIQFSTFLRILQKSGCINYLNDLQNFTLFAPVNSAFADEYFNITKFDIEDYIIHDSLILTRELVNKTVIFKENVKNPFVLGQVWDPVTESHFKVNRIPIVEPDLLPNFQNATVQGISNVLGKIPNIVQLIDYFNNNTEQTDGFTFDNIFTLINNIQEPNLYKFNKTLLIPSDDSFNNYFNSIEINYLLDTYNNLDRMHRPIREKWLEDMRTLYQNIILNGIYGGSLETSVNVSNLNQDTVTFESNSFGSQHSVNSRSQSLLSNEVFNFGLAHFFNDIYFISNNIEFDAESYLHGLNCSRFVGEMYFRGLQDIIHNDREDKITLFIPGPSENDELGLSKSALLYHFSDGHIILEDEFPALNREEKVTKIFNSSFCFSNKRLGGKCQKMKITKSQNGYHINDKFKISQSKPFKVGNTLIYTIGGDLQLPGDLILSIPPFAHCSKSISFLRQLDMLELKPNHEGYTIFLPCFDSWNSLSLNMEYIEKNPSIMEKVMKNYIISGLFYTDIGNQTTKTYNLLGEELQVKSIDDQRDTSHVILEMDSMYSNISLDKDRDIFFNKGVIHPLKEANLPKDVQISLRDLIKTTGSTEIIKYLKKFNNLADKILSNPSNNHEQYSILIPTYSSLMFEGIDMNYTKLEDFLKLHIIKGNETMGLIDCTGNIKTELGHVLECRKVSPTESFLKIKDGNDNEVRILKKGCATTNSGNDKACVFLIDRPISLKWINRDNYHFRLPVIAVGVGVVLGVTFIMSLLCCVLVLKVGKKHPKRISNFTEIMNDEEDQSHPSNSIENDVRQPLLSNNINTRNYDSHRVIGTPEAGPSTNGIPNSRVVNGNSGNVASGYSTNSTSGPINVVHK